MYTVTIILENHFQAIKTILEINHRITQDIEADHPNEVIHETSHKIDIVDQIVETIIHDQIQTQHNLFQHPVPSQIEIDIIQTISHEIHLIIEIETNQIIGTETIQTTEIEAIPITVIKIQIIDHGISHTTDQIIIDQITINTIDREIIHKIEIPVTIIDIEITPNHLIGIIIVITILSTDIEAIHQNTKDKLTKYKQTKK